MSRISAPPSALSSPAVRAFAGALLGTLLSVGPTTLPAWAQAQPAAPSQAADEYRLGPGDLVRVTVFQNPELSQETRVGDAGTLTYPLIGSLRLAGLTVQAAEARIAEALRVGGFVRQPQVSLSVLQVRGHQAAVIGQVTRPGRFPLDSARTRLTDLLAMAGGTSAGASDVVVLVGTREGQPYRAEVDLPALFAAGGQARDLWVRDGDVLWVSRQPQVYIYGEVQRPGVLRLERGMTVLQALAGGGGLSPRGTERGIRVHRKAADGAVNALAAQMADALQDGDVVHVRESLF